MPMYFFDVKDGHRLIDPTGIECRDDREAETQAIAVAAQIAADVPASAGTRHVAILNSSKEKIGEVPVGDDRAAVRARA